MTRARRAGLTLMELMVVLVILIALAAILVPMLPSMLTRAHTAAGATNVSELNKYVQTYEQMFQSYPQDFDALVDATGTLPDYIANPAGQLFSSPLTPEVRDALLAAGIVRLMPMVPTRAALIAGGGHVTFSPYDAGVIDVATHSGNLAFVTEQAIEQDVQMVSDPGGLNGDQYVVFGVGKRCTMIGRVMTEPPTHFSDNSAEDINTWYGRFGLVFRVTRGGATPVPLGRAVFVGVVEFHGRGLDGADGHLQEYYNIAQGQ